MNQDGHDNQDDNDNNEDSKASSDVEILETEADILSVLEQADSGLPAPIVTKPRALPEELYLLPLSDRPFFPAQTQPLIMNQEPWLSTVEAIGKTEGHMVGMLLIHPDNSADIKQRGDFYEIGTVVHMHNPATQDGKIQFLAEGDKRFKVVEWLSETAPYRAKVKYLESTEDKHDKDIKAYTVAIINTIKDLLPLNPLYQEEVTYFVERINPNEPSTLTDFAASLTTADKEELQGILETVPLLERMKNVMVLLHKELEVARMQNRIRTQVEEKVDEQQRQFFLREELKVIQKELGIYKDDREADLEKFRTRIEKLTIPAPVMERIDEEMDKVASLEKGSPEYTVSRNYLDWITVLPWGIHTEDKMDLKRARKVLDRDHDGLGDVKERIIEFLAIGALKGDVAGSIVLLVGPPGVGKTSIGRSVADALGREFYRFSVGGMRDEAEIKGHRRTYIGAMPGKIIHALKEVKTSNPVIMLDEIDKIGASYQGDPASALLEVLDPEQNSEFLDHYLDVRFDLSKALFLCTANQLDTIPRPLLDRMEVIRLAGYITSEKVAIAKHHLWPNQLKKAGLKKSQIKLTDPTLRDIINGYAREAGVRNLEKLLGRIVRKIAVKLVQDPEKYEGKTISVKKTDLNEYLGKPFFQNLKPMRGVGIVTGLAWTSMGGETLDIEASVVSKGKPGLKLTGQLGDVMKESAQISYSYLMPNLKRFGAEEDFLEKSFVHVHLPEGATPKDGPSAGVSMTTALLSLALNKKLPRPLAMTGELTLTGHVLAVGGIKEKVIAARRNKIMELILPDANKGDFEELPEHIREGITIHFAKRYQEVFDVIFGKV